MSSESEIELSVVMPCLDEARTLEACIRRALDTFAIHGIAGEVVIGDNGSTDGSQELARKLGARVIDVPVRGYGAALLGAFQAARGKFVIMGDSDASYDFGECPRFLEKLRAGCDLVMGNRFRGEIKPGAMPWKNRWIGNPVLSGLGRIFFDIEAGDFHCGIRGFRKDAIDRLELQSPGMEFASEMLVKARLAGLRIDEVPVSLSPDGRGRPPHLRPWRDGWRHLRFLLLYSPRWLFFYPGLAMGVLGLGIILALLPGPRPMTPFGHPLVLSVHTLLYGGALILVGAQGVYFSILSEAYGIAQGLLPETRPAWQRSLTLERGLVLGVFFTLAGLVGSVVAVAKWVSLEYGPFDPDVAMRWIVPSVVFLALGAQTIFSSFFLSLLRMGRPNAWDKDGSSAGHSA